MFQDLCDKINSKYISIAKAFQEINYTRDPRGITKECFAKLLHNQAFDLDRDGVISKDEFYDAMGDVMMPGTDHFQTLERPFF